MQTQAVTITSALADSVRAYPGCRAHFRLVADQTNNSLAVIDLVKTPGSEPPRHVHLNEDETVFLKQGEMTFFIGDDIVTAATGDVIFMPRNVPHHFAITSTEAIMTLVVTPGGFDKFFEAITIPYEGESAPPIEGAPSEEELTALFTAAERFGINFL